MRLSKSEQETLWGFFKDSTTCNQGAPLAVMFNQWLSQFSLHVVTLGEVDNRNNLKLSEKFNDYIAKLMMNHGFPVECSQYLHAELMCNSPLGIHKDNIDTPVGLIIPLKNGFSRQELINLKEVLGVLGKCNPESIITDSSLSKLNDVSFDNGTLYSEHEKQCLRDFGMSLELGEHSFNTQRLEAFPSDEEFDTKSMIPFKFSKHMPCGIGTLINYAAPHAAYSKSSENVSFEFEGFANDMGWDASHTQFVDRKTPTRGIPSMFSLAVSLDMGSAPPREHIKEVLMLWQQRAKNVDDFTLQMKYMANNF